jgi:hypothetical protein
VSSGGTTATGGSGGLGGTGPSGVGATGATPPCPEFPDPSACGEGGCQVGDSVPGGAGALGGQGNDCLYVVQTGGSGACESGEGMGPCREDFCQGGVWFAWQHICP